MPIPPHAIAVAQATQSAAAQSATAQTRLIAGPGTGKSSSIEQRVCWLLDQGIPPGSIYAVSFTRASAKDLKERILSYCDAHGHGAVGSQVRVSTLHSLALRTLRAAGLLQRFPADPLVLDQWELETIFDAEFGETSTIASKLRREEIRRYHEAFWSTGVYLPPNYLPPDPPINQMEAGAFIAYHGARTQAYSCVLPGEIVRQCVQEVNAGTINPVQLLHIQHLIVDEFQDLNPMDLEFIHGLANQGVTLFAAGDDDQSIYSFRFANPAGIQRIPQLYPAAGLHQLNECFRCMPEVLAAADRLIISFPSPNRVPKQSVSLYAQCNPPVTGAVHRWRFGTGVGESQGIAASCAALIAAGTAPRDILILLSNSRALEREIAIRLEGANVPFTSASTETFLDTKAGRFILSLLRIICDGNDYIAHRTLLGIRAGVGIRTSNAVCQLVIDNLLNYRDIFYQILPVGIFTGRSLAALNAARAVCGQIAGWQSDDLLGVRVADLHAMIAAAISPPDAQAWQDFVAPLPQEMTLQELRDFIWSNNDEQQVTILQTVYTRVGQPVPQAQVLPQRVRLMTMHGAKGLSARVVFIPGLEETILPGARRAPYPGLVLEAARLLYVSITRARAACVISYASRRLVNGQSQNQQASRFAAHLNGPFIARVGGLQAVEINAMQAHINQI